MKTSFTQFLVEKTTVDEIMSRMSAMLEVVDKDMGSVFVCRDREMGRLTGKQHTFEVRIHRDGDVEVHPHNITDHDRATEIENKLLEAISEAKPTTITEADDKRREAIRIQMMRAHEQELTHRDAQKMRNKAHAEKMEAEHGPDWKKKIANKEQADREAHNADVARRNTEHRERIEKLTPGERGASADHNAMAGRRKGSNWTGD